MPILGPTPNPDLCSKGSNIWFSLVLRMDCLVPVSSCHSLESVYSLVTPHLLFLSVTVLCHTSCLSGAVPSVWKGLTANFTCKVKFISIISIKTFNTGMERWIAQRVEVSTYRSCGGKGSVPSAHMKQLTLPVTPALGAPTPFFWPLRVHTCIYLYTYTYA